MVELLSTFGLASKGGNYQTVKNRAKEENISLDGLSQRYRQYQSEIYKKPIPQIPLDKILVENSSYNRWRLKQRLISDGLLDNKCSECGLAGIWNNKPINLQIDHINGISNDNRIENLRLICPNCHSQTETYSGRNITKIIRPIKQKKLKRITSCSNCGIPITKSSTSGKCHKCVCAERRIDRPTKEHLIDLIKENSYVAVGKMYNVSDNAIRKWLK